MHTTTRSPFQNVGLRLTQGFLLALCTLVCFVPTGAQADLNAIKQDMFSTQYKRLPMIISKAQLCGMDASAYKAALDENLKTHGGSTQDLAKLNQMYQAELQYWLLKNDGFLCDKVVKSTMETRLAKGIEELKKDTATQQQVESGAFIMLFMQQKPEDPKPVAGKTNQVPPVPPSIP